MAAATHAPDQLRAEMQALAAHGFQVREVWLDDWFDGIKAFKKVGDRCIEIWSGSENGSLSDPHHSPIVYIGEHRIAQCDSVERARRVAELRAGMVRAALAKATGGRP